MVALEVRRVQRPLAIASGAFVFLSVASVILPASAGAATSLQVTTTADSGVGSLRQVLGDAIDGDTITFAPSVMGTIALASPLTIESNVTITGPGADILSIDGGNQVQDLVVSSGDGAVTVSGLTLTHGRGTTGGAIQDDSGRALTLLSDAITNSNATVSGGGIYLSGPERLLVVDSTVSGNTAPQGGGIFADLPSSSELVVQSSTISGNTATSGQGAAIDAAGRVTLSGSVKKAHGSEVPQAIAIPPPPPPTPLPTAVGAVVITTSTIADNTAGGTNAAVFLHVLDSVSTLSADTVADNKATGLTLDNPMGDHPTMAATIVAHNTVDCAGAALADHGYDLASDGSCSFTATGSQAHSTTIDAALGSLHGNGGPTATIAISSSGDPAHAVVPDTFTVPDGTGGLCTTADQRGVLPAGSPCDIGAFQREAAPTIKASLHSKTSKTHYGWYGSPVHVTFTCHSASSAITVDCPRVIHLHNGRHEGASGKVTAQDGRTATVKLRGVSIDTIPPTIDGQTCHDALSGIASCKIHRQHGKYIVTAVDKAGNRTVRKGHTS